MRVHKAKKEIPHDFLDDDKNNDGGSARFTKIGSTTKVGQDTFKLKDKIVYPVDFCSHCGSEFTYHRFIGAENDNIVGNVWRSEQRLSDRGFIFSKFDYCLDCFKEFLIELFLWEKV